jgi:hypothetical protein
MHIIKKIAIVYAEITTPGGYSKCHGRIVGYIDIIDIIIPGRKRRISEFKSGFLRRQISSVKKRIFSASISSENDRVAGTSHERFYYISF